MKSTVVLAAAILLVGPSLARAQSPADKPPAPEAPSAIKAPAAASPAISPFGLRGIGVGTGVRLDQTFAPYSVADKNYFESVHLLSASYKVSDSVAISARTGVDRYGESGGSTTTGFLNTVIGAQYATKLGRYFRAAGLLAVALPTANGGGNAPNPDVAAAHRAGSLARAMMVGVLFTPNEVYLPFGADLAFVAGGFTAQIEVTVAPGMRVRGETATVDSSKVNSVNGALVGYFLTPELSIGAELWYQRYLSTPAAVEKDSSLRDNLSFAGGARVHLKLAGATFRPGVSYGAGLRGQVADKHVQMLQIDVPVSF